jgi:hypothetical protein
MARFGADRGLLRTVGCVVQPRQTEFSRQNDACDGRWFDRDDLDDAGFATRDMIWLIKIPLVLLVGAVGDRAIGFIRHLLSKSL